MTAFGSFAVPSVAIVPLLPVLLIIAAALGAMLIDAFAASLRPFLGRIAGVVLAVAFVITAQMLRVGAPDPFPGMYVADPFAHFFDLIFYAAAVAVLVIGSRWHPELQRGEYVTLILFVVVGMVALVHAASLVTLFIALELLSIGLYALTGFMHDRPRATEAALKYFFLGAFASAFIVFGSALIYGKTGTFQFAMIASRLVRDAQPSVPLLLSIGAGLVLAGLCFKISSVPFHMWTPDVYDGAPTPVSTFMSVGTKAAAFAALTRVMTAGLGSVDTVWIPAVVVIAVATMLVGNLIAVNQLNLKRLLAFSSIAHAGYGLLGLVSWRHGGLEALMFYLLAYAAMNVGAFGLITLLERRAEGLFVSDLAGLASRRPWTAAALTLFLLSLAGVPPTAGFLGKFGLFAATLSAGWTKLAVLAALYSAIAAYYYLRLIVYMYMRPTPEGHEELGLVSGPAFVVLILAVIAVLGLGVFPSAVFGVLGRAVAGL